MPAIKSHPAVAYLRLVAALALAPATACEDFATPAELQKPTVIAVVATPPIARFGESSTLQVVMVDQDGPLTPSRTSWTLTPTYTGYDTIGQIAAGEAGQATYVAPQTLPPLPENALPADTLVIDVEGGGASISVVKLMGVAALETTNPTVELLADDELAVDEIVLPRGETTPLTLVETPAAGEDARWAWYATVGTIEKYQSNPTEIEIKADEPLTEGWLHGVYRDGRGGVAWRSIRLSVAP